MADWPPSLKPIGRYLARAKEVQHSNALVAYYCRYFSLLRAIELRDTSDTTANLFVTNLLEKCEAEKNTIGFDDGTHQAQLEEHALNKFYTADEQDRSGNATRETATTFYAAMCFLEVCSVFGTLADDLEEKLRYAKWKAADIIKALREGRRPSPGAPGETHEQQSAQQQQQPDSVAQPVETNTTSPSASNHTSSPTLPTHSSPSAQPLYPSAQRLSPVPAAPPLREYDSQPDEYEPSAPPPPPLSFVRDQPSEAPSSLRMAHNLPLEAPPYPSSEEVSPLYPTAHDMQQDEQEQDQARVPKPTAPPIPSLELPVDSLKHDASPTYAIYKRAQPLAKAAAVHDVAKDVHTNTNSDEKKAAVRAAVRAQLGVPKRAVPKTPASPVTTVQTAKTHDTVYKPNVQQTQEAQRLCKYAASALDFEDMKTAVSNLERALQLLKGSP